jgi:N-acyl-L-homoserine lactone synthetase
MNVLKTIIIPSQNGNKNIEFGIPDTQLELDAMFQLRYEIYVNEKKYIPLEQYKSHRDIDHHDVREECTYFIAKLGNEVIGTGRSIHSNPLPIFRDYFQFSAPRILATRNHEKIVEIGRIISRHRHISNIDIPRHLIMLGIFSVMADYGESIDVVGGYGAMKRSAVQKYERIGFPIHRIKHYKQIFIPHENDDPLKNFFDEQDPPLPVYYLRRHIQAYSEAFFSHSMFFQKISDKQYMFKNPRESIRTKIALIVMRVKLQVQFLI